MRLKFAWWVCFFLAAGGLVLSFVAPELTRLFSVLLGSIIVSLVVLFVFRNRFLNQLMAHLNAGVDMRSDEESIIRKLHAEARERDAAEVMVAGINHIGEEQFLNFVADIKNAQIKLALQQTHEKIVELRRKENEQNWVTQGIAAVAEIKNKTTDITEYASQVMTTVVKMLRANQGSFFVVKKEGTDEYFELAATYAYGKKKHLQQRINLGEGLIGQAYYERDTIYMTEVPRDYVKITSGLGEALPRCICVVPLLSEGQIYGAIEVASFQKLESYQIQYLTKLAEGVAYNLHAIEVAARTEQLLTESQQMANEVKSQEEELRQNMEELTATQEQMDRKQKEIDAVLDTLSVVELDMNGVIQTTNAIFRRITGYNEKDLAHNPYINLIPEQGNDRKQFEMMWASLSSGQTFSGEFKLLNREGAETWMTGNFTPLLDASGKPYKVTLVTLFNTQEKEKLLELQETVTALKECFPIAEINPDFSFKTANDLFLSELGVRKMDLRKMIARDTFHNGSFQKVVGYFQSRASDAGNMELSLLNKNGEVKQFNAALLKVNANDRLKKGLLILKNQIN